MIVPAGKGFVYFHTGGNNSPSSINQEPAKTCEDLYETGTAELQECIANRETWCTISYGVLAVTALIGIVCVGALFKFAWGLTKGV